MCGAVGLRFSAGGCVLSCWRAARGQAARPDDMYGSLQLARAMVHVSCGGAHAA